MSKLIFSKDKCLEHITRIAPEQIKTSEDWINYCDGREIEDSNGFDGKIYIKRPKQFYRILTVWCYEVE